MNSRATDFNMFSRQEDLYTKLTQKKREFQSSLDKIAERLMESVDMEYVTGVKFQRDLTCEFLGNLETTFKTTVGDGASTSGKNVGNSNKNVEKSLTDLLKDSSMFSKEISTKVDDKYKSQEIDKLQMVYGAFKNFQETKNIAVLAKLTSSLNQRGGNGALNVLTPTVFSTTSSHGVNTQRLSTVSNDPFINLSNKVFDTSNVTPDLLNNYDQYTQQALFICNQYVQAVLDKKAVIEEYIEDMYVSDMGSLFYLMTRLTYFKEGITLQSGGKKRKTKQNGGGKIADFFKKTAKDYDEMPLSKKLFYVETISTDLMGFLLNKFLVFVGLFEIDITKISDPYQFIKEIETFINTILYDKLIDCISTSEIQNKKVSDVLRETKSWGKITLNINRMLNLVTFIFSYVPAQNAESNSKLENLIKSIKKEQELLGALKQTLGNKCKYLAEIKAKQGDLLLTDVLQNKDMKDILTMSLFKNEGTEDINYDIKCILSQTYGNITEILGTYADLLQSVKFDNKAKLSILTIFQKIGQSYNSRIVRQLYTGLTKGITRMHELFDKAQSRILSQILIGTQAVFLNATLMYGPLMINGILLVLWGCVKGSMFVHKVKKRNQQVMPVDDKVWERMLIEEDDKQNLIDKIKTLVGSNSDYLSKIDIEDGIKNIPTYIEDNVNKSFINDVMNHDFSMIVEQYDEEESDTFEVIEDLSNELPDVSEEVSNDQIGKLQMNCSKFSSAASITRRVPSIINDQIQNEISDLYNNEQVRRELSTTKNDVANLIALSQVRQVANSWLKKNNKVDIENFVKDIDEGNVNGDRFTQSIENKPSLCQKSITNLMRNPSLSVTSRQILSALRQSSVASNAEIASTTGRMASTTGRMASTIGRMASTTGRVNSMLGNQLASDNIANLSEATLRSVVRFKKLNQQGGKRKHRATKKILYEFLDKYAKKQLQDYSKLKNINVRADHSKKQVIELIMKHKRLQKL
jgi:hypothetical protein